MTGFRSLLKQATAIVSCFAIGLGPGTAALADVVAATGADGLGTVVSTNGPVSHVTWGTIRNGVAFNSFSQFNVNAGSTVNLYQPTGSSALVNLVLSAGGAPSTIAGTVNTRVGDVNASMPGGRVFMVDPNGFVVSSTGVINAAQLTLSTGTAEFARKVIDGDSSSVAALFAGTEPQSAADIEIYGQINASRLDLRAGARMVLGGQISVMDMAAGRQSVANTADIQQAAGVSMEGGVLRFTAGSNPKSSGSNDSVVGGTITARRGSEGGTVVGFVGQDGAGPDVRVSGTIDVRGTNAGSFLLFTEGSALLEPGVRIDASSTSGSGGFIYIKSDAEGGSIDLATGAITDPSVRLRGTLATGGATGDGTTWVEGEYISVAGDVTTAGGHLALIGGEAIVQGASAVNTVNAARTRGGDVLYSAPVIIGTANASMTTSAPNIVNAGLVALVARDESEGTSWNINPTNRQEALIRLDGATIRAGAVVITATAINANVVDTATGEEEAEVSAYMEQQEGVEAQLTEFLDTLEGLATETLSGAVDTLKVKLPVQVQVMTADARIEITNSSIVTDAKWRGSNATVATSFTGDKEERGVFSADGLLEGELTLFGGTGLSRKVTLPTSFDPATDAILIQSHAATDVKIAPKAYLLGVGVAVTNTVSRVVISGSNTRIEAQAATDRPSSVKIRSTASEAMDIAIAPSTVAGISIGVIVAVRSLQNQTLVKDGQVLAGKVLDISALTAKNHSLSVTSNAGKDGKGAVALNVDVGNSITEAAAGGTLRAGEAFRLNAETLYFGKAHATSSTLGLADPTKVAINNIPAVAALKDKVTSVTNKLKEAVSGKKDAADDSKIKKPGFAFGLSFDLQIDDDDTYATLGGIYRDLANGRAAVELGATNVTAAGGVGINAVLRFATPDEGGSELSRSVDSSMGFLDRLAESELQRLNQTLVAAGQPEVTKEELFGQFGYAVFLNASIALMQGETVAEIGSNATITRTRDVTVEARTVYPEFARFTEVRDDFVEFIDEVSEFRLVEGSVGDGLAVNAPPALPDVLGYLDLGNYLTTYSGAYAEQNQLEGDNAKSQNAAVAISVNVFNTDNVTRAVVRPGAVITDLNQIASGESSLVVAAEQVGFFTHMQNFPTDVRTVTNPLASNDNVKNTVGGAVTVARTKSIVEALVEGDAEITMDAVTLDAHNRAVVFNFVYAGGSAENIAINAAIGAQAVENRTIARLSDEATVTATSVGIEALDDSIVIGLAGAFAGSDGSVSVGASSVVNFAKREVYAGIGPSVAGASLAGTAGAVRIRAESLTVSARNEALTVATSVAGSRVSGKPAPAPTGGGAPQEQQNDEDTLIPSWLFKQDESDALSAQNSTTTPAGSDGSTQSSGWAVAGAATVNLMLENSTVAEVASAGAIELDGDFTVRASNLSRAITGAGAVSAGLGSTQKNNALAGAFAITVDQRDVRTLVRAVTVRADKIDITADDESLVVSVAVGGAGSSNGKVTLAGSFAASALTGETRTTVQDADLGATGDLTVGAKDASLAVSVGGAVSINLSQSEGAGVGVGVAVNVVDRGVMTEVLGGSRLEALAVALSVDSAVQIFGFGVSVGVGKTGVAGSIAVNTITGGAKLRVGQNDGPLVIRTGEFEAVATEANRIWSLAGALTGGRTAAVGGALTANVIVTESGVEVINAEILPKDRPAGWVDGDPEPVLASVTVEANASSTIGTLAAAGAAATEGTAVGVGLSGNTIDASLAARLEDSTVDAVGLAKVSATNDRVIRSLGGGVAGSGKGAGGFAATVNVLNSNETRASLNGTRLSAAEVSAEAEARGSIETAAVALSASGETSIGGAATVNVSTGVTEVTADGAFIESQGNLTLSAVDMLVIRSLSGGAALSAGGTGVGGALSANVIANATRTTASGAKLETSAGDISLTARNDSLIESLAVGLAATGGSAAVSGSIAIGYIGNEAKVTAVDTDLHAGVVETDTTPAVRGDITLRADKTSEINILSGAAAGSASAAVGGAVTVAVILDKVGVDLVAGDLYGADLSVNATGQGQIDAIAVSAAASGNTAIAPSLVYTQIGAPGSDTPAVPPTSRPANPEAGEDDPSVEGQRTVTQARDASLSDLRTRTGVDAPLPTLGGTTTARLVLGGAVTDVTGLEVRAEELAGTDTAPGIRSLAGSVAGGGTVGGGAGIAVNLLLGRTEAILDIAEGVTVNAKGAGITVEAMQTGSIQSLAFAGGGAGTFGGAGSIVINVADRGAVARIGVVDTDDNGTIRKTELVTEGGPIDVSAVQTGTIKVASGVVGVGGVAGVGGAFAVTVLSDDAAATMDNVTINTAMATPADAALPLAGAGDVTVLAERRVDISSIVAAAAAGGKGAFGGSFAINVAEGSVTAALRDSNVRAGSLSVDAVSNGTLTAASGVIAGSGFASAGLGIATNVSRVAVAADVLSSAVRTQGNVLIRSKAVTTFGGYVMGGAASGGVSFTGTAFANSSKNEVTARVGKTETGGQSDVLARGGAHVSAWSEATSRFGTSADSERLGAGFLPDANLNFAVGTAGIGAAVAVNDFANRAEVTVDAASRLAALGKTAMSVATPEGTVSMTGLRIDAFARSRADSLTVTAAAGGTAVTGIFGFGIMSDTARIRLGDGTTGGAAQINETSNDDTGFGEAAAGQDTILSARTESTIRSYNVAASISGSASVGAAFGTNVSGSRAEILSDLSTVKANRSVKLAAKSETDIENWVVSAAGGYYSIAGAVGVNVVNSAARIILRGSDVIAERDVDIDADVTNRIKSRVGSLGAADIALAGGIIVNVMDSVSEVGISGVDVAGVPAIGSIYGETGVTIDARTGNVTDLAAVSAGVGASGAVAIAGNVNVVKSVTRVDIGARTNLVAGRDPAGADAGFAGSLLVNAFESAEFTGLGGSLGGAVGLGVGATLDVTSFAGTTSVTVGAEAKLRATGGVLLAAKADRQVTSTVAALGAGIGGIAGAVSVVDMGGRAGSSGEKRDELLADVQRALGDGQGGESGSTRGSAAEITSFAGGGSARQSVVAARQGVIVTAAPGTDQIGVIIGDGAVIRGTNGIQLDSNAAIGVRQRVGSVALGGIGLSAAVATATVAVASDVRIGRNVRLLSDNAIDAKAQVMGRNNGLAVDSEVFALAASTGASINAGVSVVRLQSAARVTLGAGSVVDGVVAQRAGLVRFVANRADKARALVTGGAVSGVAGVGVSVADAESNGVASVSLGGADAVTDIGALQLIAGASDNSAVTAEATGAAGGIVSGNGSVATARNGGTVAVLTNRLVATAERITLSNASTATAEARAWGVSVGVVAVGASVATASVASRMSTEIRGGSLTATDVSVLTELKRDGDFNAKAKATSSSGALVAGNGSDARSYLDYDIATLLDDVTVSARDISVITRSSQALAASEATGRVFGLAAIGATLASSGQSADKTASAKTLVTGGVLVARRNLTLSTYNGSSYSADVTSGAGGLVSGAGGQTTVVTRTETLTQVGASGRSTGLSAGTVDGSGRLDVSASADTTLGSRIDNTSGALVGASGARSMTTLDETVQNRLLGDLLLLAPNFDLRAATTVTRPTGEYNVKSASGGVVDVAAIVSTVTVRSATDLEIGDGVSLIQSGSKNNPGEFLVGVATNMDVADKLQLDAGGAVAVPVGDSTVTVARNDATLTVRDALVQGLGEVKLYSGGNANVVSDVNSNSYGLAGAATSLARATYNAKNRIVIGGGALVTSLGDVRLQAGGFASALQTVSVRAEARAYNKTAFPINVPPVADARADTQSRIQIDEGALITSVRDIYLLSEAGGRSVVGYGRGKDLYREVLAEIGSAISQAFGGDPVSLDIETGSAVDLSDDGIIVNGRVRSGDRSQQVLILTERVIDGVRTYVNDNVTEGYAVDLARDITFTARLGVSPGTDLQSRISELNGYLANQALVTADPSAKTAWEAERDILLARQAALGTTLVDEVSVGPIIASEGNIIMRSDWVEGAATGELYAPGEAKVILWVKTGAWLRTSDIEIVNREGGRISLNDVSVSTAEDLRRLSNSRVAPYALSVVADDKDSEPRIEIVTFTPDPLVGGTPRGDGTIILAGDVENLRGEALINSNEGSVDIRGDVSARTINVSAKNDVIVGYIPGVRNIGGDPVGQYQDYFAANQNLLRRWLQAFTGNPLTFQDGFNFPFPVRLPTFELVAATEGLRAGRNVYISADKLNINGLIQAGTGTFDVILTAALEDELTKLRSAGGTGRKLLFDTAFPKTADFTPAAGIATNTNVKVYYNYETDQVEIADMFVRGGEVIITGDVISTGAGRIEALDGFGRVNVVSEIRTDLVLKRIDLGAESDGSSGVEGLVRITDTSKVARTVNGVAMPLVTEFRRIGSTMKVYDNLNGAQETQQVKIGTNDDGSDRTISIIRPTRLVSESTVEGGRTASYAPTENRDLIIVTAERTTTVVDRRREELIVIGIKGSKTDKVLNVTVSTQATTTSLGIAPYVGASLATEYDYLVTGISILESLTKTDEVKTHDSVEWWKLGSGWRHYEWTETFVSSQYYQHRLKADYAIPIVFRGSDTPEINITSQGNVIFSSTVLNQLGRTNVTSLGGSILTAGTDVILSTADTYLTAGRDIRGVAGEFRIDQTAAGRLSLVAGNRIDVRELSGDMRLLRAETLRAADSAGTALAGTIRLQAQRDLIQEDGLVSGSSIVLRAADGSIRGVPAASGEATPFRIDTRGGTLTAYAGKDVDVEEDSGDLGIVEVRAATGNVRLVANGGNIVDRNNVERRDIRTLDELKALWTEELGLNGAQVAERRATEIARIEAERTRLYHQYWKERGTGTSATYRMDETLKAALMRDTVLSDGTVIAGWTEARIAAYEAERQALYARWDGETSYDAARVITLGAEEIAALEAPGGALEGLVWTERELTRALRSDLVRRSADTTIRIEDANVIAAGNITLVARDRVGEELADHVIAAGAELSEADLGILFGAERDDIRIGADGALRIRRAEDLNFQFTSVDAGGNSTGALKVLSAGSEIFLGSEGAASLAEVAGQGRVTIRIDGNMADASSGIPATVRGGILVLEAGTKGRIGAVDKPLTVEVGESLTARAETGIYITAPTGNLPLREVFSKGRVELRALGLLSDVVATDVPRVIGGSILLSAGSIGTALAPVGVETTDAEGTLTLVTTQGDARVKGHSVIRLDRARIAQGGSLVMARGKLLSLVGVDTLSFGANSTFALVVPQGIDLAQSSGTDVQGGRLDVTTGGAVGGRTKRMETALSTLDYRSDDLAAPVAEPLVSTALWLRDAGDLRIENVLMNLSRESVTDVIVGRDLSLGLAQSIALSRFEAGRDMTQGRIIAARAELLAGRTLGAATQRIDVTAGAFQAEATEGSAYLLLRDRDMTVDYIRTGTAGQVVDVVATDAALDVQSGGLFGATGVTLRVEDLTIRGNIGSATGNIDVLADGDVVTTQAVRIATLPGTIRLDVTGDARFGDGNVIETGNATDAALSFTVDGEVSVGNQPDVFLQANAAGALTTLRFGSVRNTGPVGIRTNLDRLDSVVATGDTHLREETGILVERIVSDAGNVDLYTKGDTVLRHASAGKGTVVIGSGGSLTGTDVTVDGTLIKLFAFGGRLGGTAAGDAMEVDTESGAEVWLLARDRLAYTETAGDLRLAAGLSQSDDLVLSVAAGKLTAGVLGAAGKMDISAQGLLDINLIGRSGIDIADEVGLKLVDDTPTRYGLYEAASPMELTLRALGSGSVATVGLANVKNRVTILADVIRDSHLYDVTPEDGLRLVAAGADGLRDTMVGLHSIGDGPRIDLVDPFMDVRPALAGRLIAKTRPENSALSRATGTLTIERARLAGGEITHAGPVLVAEDVRISADVWFRQATFDLLAGPVYRALDTDADAQLLAVRFVDGQAALGQLAFVLSKEIDLSTPNSFGLNRKLGGVGFNGGQGFVFNVGAETQIMVNSFLRGFGRPGVIAPLVDETFAVGGEGGSEDEFAPSLPMVRASL